jgi:hypothetical protein
MVTLGFIVFLPRNLADFATVDQIAAGLTTAHSPPRARASHNCLVHKGESVNHRAASPDGRGARAASIIIADRFSRETLRMPRRGAKI